MNIPIQKRSWTAIAIIAAMWLPASGTNVSRVRSHSSAALWGNIKTIKSIKSEGPLLSSGYYSINPASSPVFQPLCASVTPSAVIDGRMYTFYTDNGNPFDVHHYYTVQDIYTWEVLEKEELQNSFLVPNEVAQDNLNGVVYGQFYQDGSNQLAILDPIGKEKITIGASPRRYVAMGITSDRRLFGIGTDANLYQISTEDASETLIGSTGLNLRIAGYVSEMYYDQSGEIDQTTDTFYWASTNGNGESVLYQVDLRDASLTKIADMQNKVMQSMLIPLNLADDMAPGNVEDVYFDFADESLSGEISFTLPMLSYAGSSLSGGIEWSIAADGTALASGSGNPGDKISVDTSLPDGQSLICIRTGNDAGQAYPYSVYHWTGFDIPDAVESPELTFNQKNGEVKLSWQAPKSTIHGGHMGAIAYNVYRISKAGDVLVASGISDTSFSETLEEGGILKSISYGVEPVNGDKTGDMARTRGFMWGTPNSTPWSEDFASQENFELWTVEDTNGDMMTWSCIPYFKAAYSGGSNATDCDDWLISPPIKLEEGKNYRLKYTANNEYADYYFIQRLEVKLGQSTTSGNMTQEIVAAYEVDGSNSPKETTFSVAENGTYNIGFHDVSPADMYQISLGEIYLEELSGDGAPAAVRNLSVEADSEGAHSVSIRFETPSLDKKGEPLESISKIEVTRGNDLIKSLSCPAIGEIVEVIDNNELTDGNYTYCVIAYNDNGPGEKESRTVYVGLDRPQPVDGIEVADNVSYIHLKWASSPSEGINGGYVNQDDVTYYIYEVDRDNLVQKELGHTTATEFDIPAETNTGEQMQSRWSIIARNATGSDPNCLFEDNSVAVANVKIITGKPFALPYTESFSNQSFDQFCWREHSTYRFYTAFAQGMSSDNDGVSLAFTVYELGEGTDGHFTTGKVSLENAEAPYLEFDYYFIPDVDMRYEVSIFDDRLTQHKLGTIDYSVAGNEGWKTAKYEIPVSLADSSYIMARIHAYINDTTSPMLIDNIRLYDSLSGVEEIINDGNAPRTIYTMQGIRLEVKSLDELSPGLYIINGKKTLIR